MGNYYHFHSCDLFIEKSNLPMAEQLLREYDEARKAQGYDPEIRADLDQWSIIGSHHSALEQVAEHNKWHVSFNENGGVHIEHPYDRIEGNDMADWLEVIAPTIRDGGYVEVSDDERRWRYIFHGGKRFYVLPKWEI